jgi:hypothetical protein
VDINLINNLYIKQRCPTAIYINRMVWMLRIYDVHGRKIVDIASNICEEEGSIFKASEMKLVDVQLFDKKYKCPQSTKNFEFVDRNGIQFK